MINSEQLAARLRIASIEMAHHAKAAHLGSALSCIDIIAVLYQSILNLDPSNSKWDLRDRFILSKGHAATALYAALEYKNFITRADLDSYGKMGSLLEEHPSPKLNGVEAATGSLGHGLSIGCGISLAGKIKDLSYRTYVLMSDGECNEGSTWEACLFASSNKLDNLCAFVDFNKWQATGRSREVMALDPLVEKFESFGWTVYRVDGHNHQELARAITMPYLGLRKPVIIVADTVKGKGVSFMEDNNNWHYRVPSAEEVARAKIEIGLP